MKFRTMLILLSVIAGSCFSPRSVAAHGLTLGTNFGISWLDVAGRGGTSTYLVWPASVGGLQPGLRLGYVADNPHHGAYLDTGLLVANGTDLTTNDFELTGNYQYNLLPSSLFSPYLTAGLGFLYTGLEVDGTNLNATSLIAGAGIGTRWRIGDDRGAVRAEFRFDKVTQGKDGDVIITDEGVVYGLKFGFDLWL